MTVRVETRERAAWLTMERPPLTVLDLALLREPEVVDEEVQAFCTWGSRTGVIANPAPMPIADALPCRQN